MSTALLDLTEKLVPVSDFSQGKAGKIFNDVAQNNSEYIVLKNNQPTAVLLSLKEYKEIQKKSVAYDQIFEKLENMRLLKLAESRVEDHTIALEELIAQEGFSLSELEALSKEVEFE